MSYNESDSRPVWIFENTPSGIVPTSNPVEPEAKGVYQFQDRQQEDPDTPEAVVFRETACSPATRCNNCALRNTAGCEAFRCDDFAFPRRFAEAVQYDGENYRYHNGGDLALVPTEEELAAWRGFLNVAANAPTVEEIDQAKEVYAANAEREVDKQWAQAERDAVVFERFESPEAPKAQAEPAAESTPEKRERWESALRELLDEAEEFDRVAAVHSSAMKDARKGALKVRAKIAEILAGGSANFQPSEALFDFAN